ncbi:MAG: D-alanine--D-alanine ligase [Desulfovibrio sp.]|nr:D-alanine--D-alanine ligase [Desulfovibrio sp.]MCA1985983.1 D-alanine--D-alanine ligase [Desulfovibrio sp.]
MRVLLIAGGWSSEREVSLSGGRIIQAALERLGHEVRWYDPVHDLSGLVALAREADFAFLNLHGSPGEDGLVQAVLDRVGCPYQGSGPAGSFLALHKAAAKELLAVAGVPTPRWAFLPRDPGAAWNWPHAWPVFVKPNTGGSSLGMGRAADPVTLRTLLEGLWAAGAEALVEEACAGVELTCGVLGNIGEEAPLPVILIKPNRGEFFDYASKYEQGGADELCPAPIPDSVRDLVQRLALTAHGVLGCEGYSRADFIWDGAEGVTLLEVNTLPGMTATSLVPRAARVAGLEFEALIARLMELGLARSRRLHGEKVQSC